MKTIEQIDLYRYNCNDRIDPSSPHYYEACIPSDFWNLRAEHIEGNRKVFYKYIQPYCDNLKIALSHGYGLFLIGDNGCGKTTFLSYILGCAISYKCSAYYTTILDLDYNLKSGMNDPSVRKRLEQMLSSDFLAIDEIQKEQYKDGDSWIRTQLERILKNRHDNSLPTLLASNKILDDEYGATITSLLSGKYEEIILEPIDHRPRLKKVMRKNMYNINE